MLQALKSLWKNSSYFLAALAVGLAVWFLSRDKPRPVPSTGGRPVLKDFAPGSYTVRSGLLAASANLAAYKNRIEKMLESGSGKIPFAAADADAIGKLCRDLEVFLLKVRRGASAARGISQLEAAEAARRTLVLENARLKALLGGPAPSRDRVRARLADVEESLYRLELHLEGLAAQEVQ